MITSSSSVWRNCLSPGLRLRALLPVLFCVLVTAAQPVLPPATGTNPLKGVHHWMYQLQGMEDAAAMDKLAKSPYDLLVIEPTFTLKGEADFDAKALVAKLKAARPGRLVVAYADIGEAERFRTYWDKSWKRPGKKSRAPGTPAFLLAPDPDGWSGDVSIAFWDPQWRQIWLGESGLIQKIMAAGFDGVYLDWVEAYNEPGVVKAAQHQGVAPISAMVDFIAGIRKEVRRVSTNGVVIAQNAPELIDEDPRYAGLIDGVGFEDTWFSGVADSGWDSPRGGDVAQNGEGDDATAGRLRQYQKFLRAGIPVFTIDYCVRPDHAAQVYAAATQAGLIPLVTRVSLERLTTTPPPDLK